MLYLKISSLFVLTWLFSFLFGFFLKEMVFVEFSTRTFVYFLLAVIFFLIFFFFSSLFIESPGLKFGNGFLSLVFATLPFSAHFSLIFPWLFIVLIFFCFGIFSLKKLSENTLRINFFHLAKSFFARTFTGLAIFISLIFYIFLSQIQAPFPVSLESFERFTSPIFKLDLPTAILPFVPGQEVGLVSPEIISEELKEIISPRFFYEILETRYQELSPEIRNYIIIGLSAAIFFVLKGFSFFLVWFVSLFSYFFYLFLLAIRYIRLEIEPRNKETIKM